MRKPDRTGYGISRSHQKVRNWNEFDAEAINPSCTKLRSSHLLITVQEKLNKSPNSFTASKPIQLVVIEFVVDQDLAILFVLRLRNL